ncbi:MAG: alcohol dehydrogenase catalytic domain-containing protein [Elusimicrobia bacterium]|nr:alcohol dehydrogenase catalytic domain-containing protein [Elusimicrobiota bacterium]
MKALLAKDGAATLAEVPIPVIGDGELLLALDVCGLCGTDVMKLDTRAAGAVLGHELVGRVAKAGHGAPFREGERLVVSHHVPCLDCHWCRRGQESMCRQFKATNIDPGGFADFVRIPAPHAAHAAFRVHDDLDAVSASQTEPLACVLRNVKRLKTRKGDVVGVVGLGAIGQMTAQLLTLFGATPVGLDLDAERVKTFSRWGRGFTDAAAFAAEGKERSDGRGFDAAVYSAGTPALVANCLPWLRDGGTVNVFASFHPESVMPLDLNQIYFRELTVVSSYSPSLADLKEAFDLIASRRFDPLALSPMKFPLSAFDDAVRAVKSRKTLKSVLVPG